MNVSSVNTVHLDGLAQLYEHRFVLVLLFLLIYVFVILSDSLVIYVICSQRSLHRPMYMFVAAVLFNSAMGSSTIYPKLVRDLVQGRRVVILSRSECLFQAFITSTIGSTSFMLLSAMAVDRYLSICHPLRYAALMSPKTVFTLLLLCWLVPASRMAGSIFLASRLPICNYQATKVYCDTYAFISMSCEGRGTAILNAYGLISATSTIFLPLGFMLFSYSRILYISLHSSKVFSTKAFNTCLPHLLVFMSFSFTVTVEISHKRLTTQSATVGASILVVVIPSVFNPVIYGLKLAEVYRHIKRLLCCQRAAKTQLNSI